MKRPAEIITGLLGIVAALVTFGVLDEENAAWIVAGLGLVPAVVTGAVEWWRKRPSS